MNHCFKTSQYFKFPFGLASRCGPVEWNIIQCSSQQAALSVPTLPSVVTARPFGSLCLATPSIASAPQLPAHSSPQQLAKHLQQLSRQLVALEAVHQLQTTADLNQLRAAALSDTECRAFLGTAPRLEPVNATEAAGCSPESGTGGSQTWRMSADPPGGAEPSERTPTNSARPSMGQLRSIESNLLLNLPRLFTMTQDFTIYHKDLLFDNRIRGTKTVGVTSYIKQCALLRLVGHIRFTYVTFEVLQSSVHPEDDAVRLRWRIRGVSALTSMALFWKVNVFKMKKTVDDEGVVWYDGYSTFHVGSDGLIHTHVADKVMPDWSRTAVARPALGGLAALVYGLLPEGAGAAATAEMVSQPLVSLTELGQLATLTARLEKLERQIETALPLSAAHFQAADTT